MCLSHQSIPWTYVHEKPSRLDVSFIAGDKVSSVINSQLSDGFGGYYNMNVFVEHIEHKVTGEGDVFTTSMTLRNGIPVVPKIIEKD